MPGIGHGMQKWDLGFRVGISDEEKGFRIQMHVGYRIWGGKCRIRDAEAGFRVQMRMRDVQPQGIMAQAQPSAGLPQRWKRMQ